MVDDDDDLSSMSLPFEGRNCGVQLGPPRGCVGADDDRNRERRVGVSADVSRHIVQRLREFGRPRVSGGQVDHVSPLSVRTVILPRG